jgi:hypothetical protein
MKTSRLQAAQQGLHYLCYLHNTKIYIQWQIELPWQYKPFRYSCDHTINGRFMFVSYSIWTWHYRTRIRIYMYTDIVRYPWKSEPLTAVVMKSYVLWDITSCSPSKANWRFGGTCRLHLQGQRISQALCFMLVSCLAHSSTLKMEGACFSQTSVDFQRTTRHSSSDDRIQLCTSFNKHL